jgi:kinesin family protein 11
MKALAASADAIVREAQAFAQSQHALAASARAAAVEAVDAETARLRAQNTALARALEGERARAASARDALATQIAGLLADYAEKHDSGVRGVFSAVQAGNRGAEAALTGFRTAHTKVVDEAMAHGQQAQAAFEKKSGDLKRTRDGAVKVSGNGEVTAVFC